MHTTLPRETSNTPLRKSKDTLKDSSCIFVLYIDDEPSLLDIAKMILEKTRKFQIDICSSAFEAQQKLLGKRYDVVVSDYQMPGMDGIEFLKYVRREYGDLPFILFTGKGREEVVIQALENGVNFYLQKGGEPKSQFAELQNKIERSVNEKRAILASRISEKRYQNVFNSSADAMVVLDRNSERILDANQQAIRLYGYTLDEFRHRTIPDLIADDLGMIWPSGDGLLHIPEQEHRKKDGTTFSAEISGNIYPQKTRTIAIITIRDITAKLALEAELRIKHEELQSAYRKLAASEEALRHNLSELLLSRKNLENGEKKYRSVLDNIEDAYFRSDLDGKLILVSSSAVRMFGYDSVDEMVGQDISIFYFHPESRQKVLDTIKTQRFVSNWIEKAARKDGSTFWMSINGRFYYDDQGQVLGTEGSVRDVTQLKLDEEALREANKKLNIMNTVTRHDILNQVMLQRGYIEMVLRSQHTPSDMKERITKLDTISQRIASLINFTKDYQNIGFSSPSWVNMHTLIGRTWRNISHESVQLDNAIDPDLEVYVDPLIEKTIFNIFDNAIRHGFPKISAIRFYMYIKNGTLVLICEDNGIGIPEDEKEKIFEKGYGKITGLGLFLSREILDITGLTIKETGKQGSGARFEIRVPQGRYRKIGNGT